MENSKQPIYPFTPMRPHDNESANGYLGLTKLEYFAGLAMQGLLTRLPNRPNNEVDLGILECQRIAEESVIMAKQLLIELEK